MFYDRLSLCCSKKGIKINALTQLFDTSKGTISGWKKGASPNSTFVVLAANYFGVSSDYLLGLCDDPTPSSAKDMPLETREMEFICELRRASSETRDNVYKMAAAVLGSPTPASVPAALLEKNVTALRSSRDAVRDDREGMTRKHVEGPVAAGVPRTAVAEDWDACVWVPDRYASDRYFVVRAQGDSMTGFGVDDGDYVVLDKESSFDDNCVALVAVDGGTDEPDLTLKRVCRKGRNVVLYAYNPAYEPMVYPARDVSLRGEYVESFSPEDCQ